MKCLRKNISALFFICLVAFMTASLGLAEDLSQQLSLDSSSLTEAPYDVKDPEPGIITARYGFIFAKDFISYLGTGLAYSYRSDARNGDITDLKTGLAAQIGFNYLLGTNSTLKLDYKYLSLSPEQSRGDSRTPPQSLGIGLDIKF